MQESFGQVLRSEVGECVIHLCADVGQGGAMPYDVLDRVLVGSAVRACVVGNVPGL